MRGAASRALGGIHGRARAEQLRALHTREPPEEDTPGVLPPAELDARRIAQAEDVEALLSMLEDSHGGGGGADEGEARVDVTVRLVL